MKFTPYNWLVVTGLLLATGCRPAGEAVGGATRTVVTGHPGGAYVGKNATRYDLENHEKIVFESWGAQRASTCSGLQERVLEDGRLEVGANIRNRVNKRVQLQISCVFKDMQGFSTGDEVPWQTLILTENAQETVRFVSMNDKAKGYTIRVREAR